MEHANIDETNIETIGIKHTSAVASIYTLVPLGKLLFKHKDFEVLEVPNREQKCKNTIFTFFILSINSLRR